MLIIIDNYDSFTYNLVQYFGELGAELKVFRNDSLTLEELIALQPDQLVVSPGPGVPEEGGISNAAILYFTGKIPVLGVCLGHQCLGAVYGGSVVRAGRLMHGKTSMVTHNGEHIFAGIPSPFEAMRYHSLIVNQPLPEELEITATTAQGEIMGLKHRRYPTYGVQFHPESILTQHGKKLLQNFLDISPKNIA
jgi:anthranilate synthase/aminodeoxychorismate synthase-like glutamine amidotransferase